MARRGGVLRLTLLLLVVTGVLSMHTMGHPSGHVGPHSLTALVGHEPMTEVPTVAMSTMPQWHGKVPTMPLNPLEVCVAVLVAGLLLLLASLMLARLRGVTAPSRLGVFGPVPGRGPPRSLRLGLLLADLSVLRN